MSPIEIKHWNGNVLYTIEADSIKAAVEALVQRDACLRGADLRGAYLTDACLRGADLRGACLRGADLRGADLRGACLTGACLTGACLTGADLRGAEYGDGVPLTKTPIFISGFKWDVMILDSHLKIGCELHSFKKWGLEGDTIAKSHSEEKWWKQHKDAIFAVIRAVR